MQFISHESYVDIHATNYAYQYDKTVRCCSNKGVYFSNLLVDRGMLLRAVRKTEDILRYTEYVLFFEDLSTELLNLAIKMYRRAGDLRIAKTGAVGSQIPTVFLTYSAAVMQCCIAEEIIDT